MNQEAFEKYCNVQWFPGHMTKTLRTIQKLIKNIDIVVEIIDARIPLSSRNPEITKISENKPKILIINKCDLADENLTNNWIDYYSKCGFYILKTDCQTGKGVNGFLPLLKQVLQHKIISNIKKDIVNNHFSVMITGVPNVGKSSFINRMCKSRITKVEDRPGVTRGIQWIKVDKDIDMLDVPGLLWPKFKDPAIGERLAFTGAIRDEVLDIEYLAIRLIHTLIKYGKKDGFSRYKIFDVGEMSSLEVLQTIGKNRGMLMSGGDIDTERAAIMIIDEYRNGSLGRVTLDISHDIM